MKGKKRAWPRGAMLVWPFFCWDSCLGLAFFFIFFLFLLDLDLNVIKKLDMIFYLLLIFFMVL